MEPNFSKINQIKDPVNTFKDNNNTVPLTQYSCRNKTRLKQNYNKQLGNKQAVEKACATIAQL